jgi:hypothetical protein
MVELDRNLRGNFPHGFLNFVGGVSQPVRINIDSDATPQTARTLAQLQLRNCLFEVMPTLRALKFDDTGVDVCHLKQFRAIMPYMPAPHTAKV